MTRIYYDDGGFSLTMKGHAGAAPAGQDIVCAAASMLMFTLQAAVEDHMQALMPTVLHTDGEIRISCRPAPRQKKLCRTIYRTIFTGCELLAQNYPDHVMTIREGT